MKQEFWLHVPTFTFAVVTGDFGEFLWNGKKEKSYWRLFRDEPERGWVYIGDMKDDYLEVKVERDALKAEVERLKAALKLADGFWFDIAVMPRYSCLFCNLGEAGAKTNDDGHDNDCPISAAHLALKGEGEK